MNYYILAGGKSSRMGRNKALLKLDGLTIIERVISAVPAKKQNIKIVTNSSKDYEFLGYAIIKDVHPGLGPISGVHAGLTDSSYESNFFLACDLPFLSEEVIRTVLARHSNQEILGIKSETGREPLCTIYSKNCIPSIENLIKIGDYSLQSLFKLMAAEFFEYEGASSLFNLNTVDDWKHIGDRQRRRSKFIRSQIE